MTLPHERTRAVTCTYDFLCDLMDRTKTPRVPQEIRLRARSLLKHYPGKMEMEMVSSKEDQLAEQSPDVLRYQVFSNKIF